MGDMLKYEDCGLKNIWLANGFRYEDVDGLGVCLEIDDIDGHGWNVAFAVARGKSKASMR